MLNIVDCSWDLFVFSCFCLLIFSSNARYLFRIAWIYEIQIELSNPEPVVIFAGINFKFTCCRIQKKKGREVRKTPYSIYLYFFRAFCFLFLFFFNAVSLHEVGDHGSLHIPFVNYHIFLKNIVKCFLLPSPQSLEFRFFLVRLVPTQSYSIQSTLLFNL